uniref:Uncharacterized protein n=1 Tax=viral metagenome TaxID=1070528 RepID=A0A6C0LH05_9ZZZZ
MKTELILSIILFIVVLIITHPRIKETFTPYDTCIGQGYPMSWCLKTAANNSASDPCICPPGQKLSRRYGTCYCQGYAS